jgi:peptide/nickel transport system substrate-binding protein
MLDISRRGLLYGWAALAAGTIVGRPAFAQQSDTIRLGMGAAKVATIDPSRQTQGVDNWAIEQVYDRLVRGPVGRFATLPEEYQPSLAERWEGSADAKTWTFHLRKDVKFQKGYGDLTSEDVKFSFDRAGNDKDGATNTAYFTNIAETVTEGPHIVHIKLKAPDPLFLTSVLAGNYSNIVSKKAVEERGDGFGMDPIGTGPYQVDFVRPDLVKLTVNPDYWGPKPKTAKIEIQYIQDTSARTFAILGGTVDMILAPAGPGTINAIMGQNPKLQMDIALPGNSWSVAFNLTKKPFDDLRVRQAFAYAIDKQVMADSLTPPTPRLYGLNAPSVPGALTKETTPPELQFNYDPHKSKALLAEAGFGSGLNFSCFCSQRDDYASLMLIMQEQLRKVGVNMDLKLMDHSAFHADNRKALNTFSLRGGTYAPVATIPVQNELLAAGEVKPDSSGGNNFAHYGVAIPGIDELYAKTMNEPNLEKRLELSREIELQTLRDLPVISLVNTAYVIIRNPRMDLGYKVTSGYGYWRLTEAVVNAT